MFYNIFLCHEDLTKQDEVSGFSEHFAWSHFYIRTTMFAAPKTGFVFVFASSGPRPRTKRVKIDCTLSADYYNIN
jgi:hypothetical protein